MVEIRTRKNKENPHYGFLVSWEPRPTKKVYVKRETKFSKNVTLASSRHAKRAESLAQAEAAATNQKGIVRSLIRISLILILELVIYLAWSKFILS